MATVEELQAQQQQAQQVQGTRTIDDEAARQAAQTQQNATAQIEPAPIPAPTGTLAAEATPLEPLPVAATAPAAPITAPAPQPVGSAEQQAAAAAGPVQVAQTPDQTVAGQITGLLAQESPFITQARARAQQKAQARGLQSSSIAVQAGEQAAISAALPIAQQDAATKARQAEQAAGFEQQFAFAGFDQASRTELQRLENEFAQGQITQQGNQRLTELRESAELSRLTNVQLENLSAANRGTLLETQAELDRATSDLNFSRDQSNALQTAYINGVSNLNTQFNEIQNSIQQNPDITNKAEALEIAQATFDDSMNLLNASFSSMPGWEQDFAVVSGGVGAAGTPIGGDAVAPADAVAPTTPAEIALTQALSDKVFPDADRFVGQWGIEQTAIALVGSMTTGAASGINALSPEESLRWVRHAVNTGQITTPGFLEAFEEQINNLISQTQT